MRLSARVVSMQRGRPSHLLVIMHDWLAPAGVLGECIIARGATYTTVLPHEGYSSEAPHEPRGLPADHRRFDGLLVLGGAMAATDDANYPHLAAVLALIRAFHAAEKPVLGVCLGAQLVARAFGGRVYPQGWLEFGFHPIVLTEAGRIDPLLEGMGPNAWIMQWHEDNFDLPEDASLLATGRECPNQVFRVGKATYGLQCHLEVNADIARSWVRVRREPIAGQDPGFFARFEQDLAQHMRGAMAFGRAVGTRWLDLVEARRHRGP